MNLTLTRTKFTKDGIFGELKDENGNKVASTLEHAYRVDGNDYYPKLPEGVFVCELGKHRLASMTEDFLTYGILGVPGHTNILFHVGNRNNDSEGCVLLGEEATEDLITRSKLAFNYFMVIQREAPSFRLLVVDEKLDF